MLSVYQFEKYMGDNIPNHKAFKKREVQRLGIVFSCIGMMTYYGYAKARHKFFYQRKELIEKHSVSQSYL